MTVLCGRIFPTITFRGLRTAIESEAIFDGRDGLRGRVPSAAGRVDGWMGGGVLIRVSMDLGPVLIAPVCPKSLDSECLKMDPLWHSQKPGDIVGECAGGVFGSKWALFGPDGKVLLSASTGTLLRETRFR